MRNRKAERNGEENMMYSTVFFDLDGTLTDSAEGILNSLEYALRSMTGTVPPREELYAFIGPPLLDAFRERLGMSEEEAARALLLYREYYLSRGIRENRLIDGAVELLTRLHRAGFRLAVATSKPEPQAEQILREFSVDGYFALVAGSTPDQSRARKEDVLRDALHRLGSPDPRSCLMIGDQIEQAADTLLDYGVAEVLVAQDPQLRYFRSDNYTAVFAEAIRMRRPAVVLVGATVSGRSLAPRVAARFRTGLTADCTVLQMRENTDLVQIRPAFGGNIMAQILNTHHRPQFATVRYKVMDPAHRRPRTGQVVRMTLNETMLKSRIQLLKTEPHPQQTSIADAEVLVAVGRGIRDEKTLQQIQRLAGKLGAQLACSRPLVESGRFPVYRQIGLSGRTVKPKLILTLGISGAIQFTAGMNQAEKIIAVNTDPQAPIFDLAHVAVVGDAARITEQMLKEMEEISEC